VGESGEWLNEKVLWHLPLPGQHQHPGVDSETIVGVRRWLLQLLSKEKDIVIDWV
jgi:hypothetical protein